MNGDESTPKQSVALNPFHGLTRMCGNAGMTWAVSGKLIACGWKKMTRGMLVRFIVSPFIMIVTALALRLKGDNYRFAVLQVSCSLLDLYVQSDFFTASWQHLSIGTFQSNENSSKKIENLS